MKRVFAAVRTRHLRSCALTSCFASPATGHNVGYDYGARSFSSNPLDVFHKPPLLGKPRGIPTLPTHEKIEEERHPAYEPDLRYFAYPGEVIGERFELITKLGYGGCSSTWLARDLEQWRWQPDTFYALKIFDAYQKAEKEAPIAPTELTVAQHVRAPQDPEDMSRILGFGCLRLPVAGFDFETEKGVHNALLFEPMRETLADIKHLFADQKYPLFLLKYWVRLLLCSLKVLHDDHRIVHTDIKPANIFIRYEDDTLVNEHFRERLGSTIDYKTDEKGRRIFESLYVFPALQEPQEQSLLKLIPCLGDFGAADRQPPDAFSIQPAQSSQFRAPEVILGSVWSTPIDIWNLGVLMWLLLEDRDLFEAVPRLPSEYDPAVHLASIYALLGKPSKHLIKHVEDLAARPLEYPSPLTLAGTNRACKTPRELWGGPYFDAEGSFLHEDLIPKNLSFENSITSLEGEEKAKFLRFARRMICWDPAERATAAELINDPWLDDSSDA